jgi:Tfp pilus assembly protein PilF
MAITVLILMLLMMAGVAVYFSIQEGALEEHEFEALLKDPAATNKPPKTGLSTSTPSPDAIESLLTDLGGPTQPPPPSLSPQKMAEAMAFLRSAQQYIRSRDMEAAEREVAKALKVWPDMNLAIRLLGSIFTQRGQFDQAIILLEKSLARDPFSAETLNNLAINYMQKNMMGKAEELLLTALQVRPDYSAAILNLGFLYLRMGRYDIAAENFEAGLQQMPDNPGVLNNLAVCLIRLGDFDAARAKLQLIIDADPNRSMSYFNMAISYAIEQDYDQALEWIRRGADYATPSQLQSYLSDADFNSLRSHPDFQRIIQDQFPQIPARPLR